MSNVWEPTTPEVEEAPKPSSDFAAAREDAKPKRIRVKPVNDPVNSPAHYTAGGIETIEYIKAKLTPEEFVGYLKGNVIKYTSRAGKKQDTIQDLEKAQWYMNRQIKELKGEVK